MSGAERADPARIAAQLAELREAGAKLRRRPPRETLDALARWLEGWRAQDSPWRRGLESELPAATGFSPPVVREGLARALAPWSGDALRRLVADELGGEGGSSEPGGGRRLAHGFDTTAVLLAGAIPMPSLLAVLAPLALRSPVLAKPAGRDPVTPSWLRRSLAEVDAELAQCLALAEFRGDDEPCVGALCRADCVVATGSDETVAAVAARVQPPRRLVAHGHRLSLAVLAPPACDGPALEAAAAGIALDTALWDQLGCLSPQAVYVVGGDAGAADRAAEALARALERVARELPPGAVDPADAARLAHERAEAELRAASGRRVALHRGEGWTVVREDDARPRPAPLQRFLRVHPVADAAALRDALRPLGTHLAGVALAGGESLAPALAGLGASRVCRPGALQTPPLAWPRDGCGVLLPLARLAGVELATGAGADD